MLRLKIFTVGKIKERWLQEALEEYTMRLKPVLVFEWILAKNEEQLKQFLSKEKELICLSPEGKQLSSEEFSHFLTRSFESYHSTLHFVIGGAEGIPKEILAKADATLSFSRMTFTHQIARLILVEQVYRALEIAKGSRYHK